MAPIFCCLDIQPYRPSHLLHETKFKSFMAWATLAADVTLGDSKFDLLDLKPPFAVQLVRQVNYGALESKRYFVPVNERDDEFIEIAESDLIEANFQKLNSYKNFKCDEHNKFFEVNIYQKDPINKHHWRTNLARPASSIDL
ncbi:hypothetical protein B0T26DRAFT_865322 [Lasiosphaeria miniovina]|uniref:Uncharacterized protein n=1 Tax=Lasiosphaeria miniovina TaxID=1954250 RepID=A0AA40DIV7_9PEZI|nr:uncharacterized protein B0T26DRAFT_865322 [Lasiosphaeria miniovina]KAK0701568.1 hypothetical protein B0T26DRAFT_865322 [Lasiosphaeria miniovina]